MRLRLLPLFCFCVHSFCQISLQLPTSTYGNISLVSPQYCEEMRMQVFLFYDEPPFLPQQGYFIRVIEARQPLPLVLAEVAVNATILIADDVELLRKEAGSCDELIFAIRVADGEELKTELQKADNWMLSWLFVEQRTDCALLKPLVYVWTFVSLVWILFLALWLCNTYYWNPQYVWNFHKLLTLLLAFKMLSVYCAYSKFSACPLDSMPATLIDILQNIFKTLYETSLFTLLLTLSTGLFLIRRTLERDWIKYFSALIGGLYLVVSAKNMLDIHGWLSTLCIIAIVWINCCFFGATAMFRICKMMRDSRRQRLSERILRQKRRYFLSFLILEQLYFVLEFVIHLFKDLIFAAVSENVYKRMAEEVALHEGMEVVVVSFVFLFFSSTAPIHLLPMTRFIVPRIGAIPLYRAVKSPHLPGSFPNSSPVVLLNPTSVPRLSSYTLAFADRSVIRDVELSTSVGRL